MEGRTEFLDWCVDCGVVVLWYVLGGLLRLREENVELREQLEAVTEVVEREHREKSEKDKKKDYDMWTTKCDMFPWFGFCGRERMDRIYLIDTIETYIYQSNSIQYISHHTNHNVKNTNLMNVMLQRSCVL